MCSSHTVSSLLCGPYYYILPRDVRSLLTVTFTNVPFVSAASSVEVFVPEGGAVTQENAQALQSLLSEATLMAASGQL